MFIFKCSLLVLGSGYTAFWVRNDQWQLYDAVANIMTQTM